TAPAEKEEIPLRAEVRRQAFLIFKESIHNIVRHAECSRVEIVLRTEQNRLLLRLSDNGRGFGTESNGQGHGLASMRQRARSLGGDFELWSAPGRGTTIAVSIPMDPKSELKKNHLNR